MTPQLQIIQGDSLTKLRKLPSDSVHCVCTSPPFFGLRDYRCDGQIGLEPTLGEYLDKLVAVFAELRRVLHPSGVCFCDIGDSYSGSGKGGNPVGGDEKQNTNEGSLSIRGLKRDVFKPKDRLLVPFRLAIALQLDGWWVRDVICWHKPAPMPENVTDRFTQSWEPILMLTKRARYFFDQEAIREPNSDDMQWRAERGHTRGVHGKLDDSRNDAASLRGDDSKIIQSSGRNRRSVWTIASEPQSIGENGVKHFARFPTELPKICILAGTSASGVCPKCLAPWERQLEKGEVGEGYTPGKSPDFQVRRFASATPGFTREVRTVGWASSCKCEAGDPVPAIVLDPFAGTFTTCAVALELGRSAIGIDLSEGYCEIGRRRCACVTPGLALA